MDDLDVWPMGGTSGDAPGWVASGESDAFDTDTLSPDRGEAGAFSLRFC